MTKILKPIGFDLRIWKHPGMGRYATELFRALIPQMKGVPLAVITPSDFNWEEAPEVQRFLCDHSIYSLGEQWAWSRYQSCFSLLHVPNFHLPLFYSGKRVVTVHDLIYLKVPQSRSSFFVSAYVKLMLARYSTLSKIIAVSENTKKDLLTYVPRLKPDKIVVIPEAASPYFLPLENEESKRFLEQKGVPEPFFLFVGTLKPHKNLETLVLAYQKLKKKAGLAAALVVVGRFDLKNRQSRRHLAEEGVWYMGEVSDEVLRALYNRTLALVFPSRYEGFGLPVLEAMACGAPVILSNASSLPELAGNDAVLLDPRDVDGFADAMYNILSNKELRSSYSHKSIRRAQHFSWEKVAASTWQVYREVLEL